MSRYVVAPAVFMAWMLIFCAGCEKGDRAVSEPVEKTVAAPRKEKPTGPPLAGEDAKEEKVGVVSEIKDVKTVKGGFPDFGSIRDVSTKKKRFFGFLRPKVEEENARIRKKRERLLKLYEKHRRGEELSRDDLEFLGGLVSEYDVGEAPDVESRQMWETLLRRVDTVPAELALAQAAIESGWGTSRFARQGNNFFGMWCFRGGCGLVPSERDSGANHEVARYGSVAESVRAYLHNLNTGPAYEKLRQLRYERRQSGEALDACSLVEGLRNYSERRDEYVKEVKNMIKFNRSYMNPAPSIKTGNEE